MDSRGPGMISRLKSLRGRRAVAAILVTAVTLLLIGGVILTTTTIGCGPAQTLGLKGLATRCSFSPTAVVITTPGPTTTPSPGKGGPSDRPFTPVPYTPPAPTTPPPYVIPDSGPASGAYPTFVAPASGPNPAVETMSCRLPVYVGPAGSGGFIVFPGGNYIADPKSSVTIPSPSPGSPSPPPPQYGYPGFGTGLSYDRAFSRWVPVPSFYVSPDGSRYAHTSTDSVYVENVATGATTELGQGHAWTIIGVQNQGVYATIVNEAGLWLLPYSGTAKQITTTGYWQLANAVAAYGTTASAVPEGVANTIVRLDLTNGAVSDWFTRGGGRSEVIGFDASGNAVITVSYFTGGAFDVWVTKGLQDRTPIFGNSQGLGLNGRPIADSHGIWFAMWFSPQQGGASTAGIALYVAGSGLYWMSSLGTQLGGACV